MKTYKETIEYIASSWHSAYMAGHLDYRRFDIDLVMFIYGFPGGVVLRDVGATFNKKVRR